jgi:hypothetical protein
MVGATHFGCAAHACPVAGNVERLGSDMRLRYQDRVRFIDLTATTFRVTRQTGSGTFRNWPDGFPLPAEQRRFRFRVSHIV